MTLMKDINTYGELCEEIERVKKSIEKVKKGTFYEFGDEFDLKGHHIKVIPVEVEDE